MEWRLELAKVAGVPLPLMDGFWDGPLKLDRSDPRHFATALRGLNAWLPMQWQWLCPDVIHDLLHHSDCEGSLPWERLNGLAARLEELAEQQSAEPWLGSAYGVRYFTLKFAAGCREAADAREDLIFS
jgi:hypothetical protein